MRLFPKTYYLVRQIISSSHYALSLEIPPRLYRETTVARQTAGVTTEQQLFRGQLFAEISVGSYAQSVGKRRARRHRLCVHRNKHARLTFRILWRMFATRITHPTRPAISLVRDRPDHPALSPVFSRVEHLGDVRQTIVSHVVCF